MLGTSYFVLFFFSSRRRHTRWPRDWSSDVCSSDLAIVPGEENAVPLSECFVAGTAIKNEQAGRFSLRNAALACQLPNHRSEERRVGKECRARWWAEPVQKKDQRITGQWMRCNTRSE